MKIFFILALAFGVVACGEQVSLEPETQVNFKKLTSSLSKQYENVKDSDNALAENDFKKRFEKELKQTNRRANSWFGRFVSSYGDNEELTIELENGSHTYHLILFEPKAVSLTQRLSKGDGVIFSGDLGHEISFSMSGALQEPEFRFYPFKIKLQGDEEWVTQSKKEISYILREEASRIADSYVEIEVAVQCQNHIKSQLKFPESADFSLLYDTTKKEDGKWVYSSTVHAKNGLGNEIPYRFYCLAEGSYTDGSAEVSILRAEFIDG